MKEGQADRLRGTACEGEKDGRDYYFLTEAEFLARIGAGDFLEHVVSVSGS